MRLIRLLQYTLLAAVAVLSASAHAEDPVAIELTLKDHLFVPSEIRAPAGKPIAITLKNEDDTPEEFDSTALKTEKIVAAHGRITIRLKAQKPGRYPFMGEYHDKTAQGVLIVE
jgi:cupredoxin-like protein